MQKHKKNGQRQYKWIVLEHPDGSPAIMRADRIVDAKEITRKTTCRVIYDNGMEFEIAASALRVMAEKEEALEDAY